MLRRSERKRTPALLPGELPPSLAEKAQPVVRCDGVWEKGVAAKPAEEYPVWMKPSKNCAIPVDGKYAYVSPPSDLSALETYIREVERVDSAEGFRNKAGVYTWILYRTKDDPTFKFAAARVNSVIELGTLHHALARGTGAVTVHGAGELKKRDAAKHEILVNFQSGSFMEKWILPEDLCTLPEMERFLLGKLREVLKGLRIETPRKASFITDELTPPTMDELKSYGARGFKVCLYDTPTDCRSKKGTCENPLVGGTMRRKGGEQKPTPPTPRKAYLARQMGENTSQAAKARQVFASQGLLAAPRTPKEQALQSLKRPIAPASVGLGRNTRRVRKGRRITKKSK